MKNMMMLLFVLNSLIFQYVQAADIAGIKIPDTDMLANQSLVLNGYGIRYKNITKISVVALYLKERKTQPQEIMNTPELRRLSITLMRDMSNNDYAQAFIAGIQKNADKSERAAIVQSLLKFGELFSIGTDLKKGDVVQCDWIPGTGAIFSQNGKKLGDAINDPLFYSIFLRIFLGEHPADDKLKLALLNGKDALYFRAQY